jgi:Tol biopolymer transport system component
MNPDTSRRDPGFDPRIADWLEEDPSTAPREVLGIVLAAYPSIPQRRAWRTPWRFPNMFTNRLAVAAAALVLVVVGGGLALNRFNGIGGPGATPSPSPTLAPTPSSTVGPSATSDTATIWHGQILVEHFGNAPDGSENDTSGAPPKHRFYLVDPNNMTRTTYTEFLPGQPASGKSSADVSRDGTKVVFQDWTEQSSIYLANLDGSGFRKLTPTNCRCREWDPAFDPTAARVVYGHAEGAKAWLEILDLATGARTKVPHATDLSSADGLPESPSWSPDGTEIVFIRTTWSGQPGSMGLVHYDELQSPKEAFLIHARLADGIGTGYRTGADPLGTIIPGDPFFSPDGKKVLFTDRPYTKMPKYPPGGVYTMDVEGSDLTNLTKVIPSADSASWTPDGKYILSDLNFFALTSADGGSGGGLVDPHGTDDTEDNVGYIYVGFWVGNP